MADARSFDQFESERNRVRLGPVEEPYFNLDAALCNRKRAGYSDEYVIPGCDRRSGLCHP
jgi:hypothetical protein